MQIEYTGRQVAVSNNFRAMAETGIGRIVKILGRATRAHVTLSANKYRQRAEVTVKTRLNEIVGVAESNNMEMSLRDALSKAEARAIRGRQKTQTVKRQPKEEKLTVELQLARQHRPARSTAGDGGAMPEAQVDGSTRSKKAAAVTVRSLPAEPPVREPHVVHAPNSVAPRPMTLEEAVKEAEFRDRDVFVFHDNAGDVMVLHRKHDGKMELIEAT